MQKMIIKSLPEHIQTAIQNGSITPGTIAQLLVEGSVTNRLDIDFHKYSPVYRQTNEPLSQYLSTIDIKDKDVLSVVGSGDFLLSLVNKGANHISTFDISIFTKYYQELKIAALMHLSYDEFLKFFYSNECFDEELYGRIIDYVTPEAREFWDAIFDYYEAKDIESSPIFMQQNVNINNGIKNAPYLENELEYQKTREQIKKINFSFYNLNVLEVPFSLQRKFDIILLSNIGDYTPAMGQNLEARLQYLRNKMGRLLNANGVVISTVFGRAPQEYSGPDWEVSKVSDAIAAIKLYKRK